MRSSSVVIDPPLVLDWFTVTVCAATQPVHAFAVPAKLPLVPVVAMFFDVLYASTLPPASSADMIALNLRFASRHASASVIMVLAEPDTATFAPHTDATNDAG